MFSNLHLKHENGPNAVTNYFPNGSKVYSKERVEVFSKERTLVMHNWRKLQVYGFRGFSKSSSKKDKGHLTQFKKLVEQQVNGGDSI